MLGPTHSWTQHSVGPWQYLGCSDDTYYLYIVVIRMAYSTCREKYYLFLCYFLQPKGVMWTTRKQDFQDSRKVYRNWNHSFLLNCQISHRRRLCSRDLALRDFELQGLRLWRGVKSLLSWQTSERRFIKKGLVLNKISTFFVFLSKIPLLYCPLIVYFTCHFITESSFFPYNSLVWNWLSVKYPA